MTEPTELSACPVSTSRPAARIATYEDVCRVPDPLLAQIIAGGLTLSFVQRAAGVRRPAVPEIRGDRLRNAMNRAQPKFLRSPGRKRRGLTHQRQQVRQCGGSVRAH